MGSESGTDCSAVSASLSLVELLDKSYPLGETLLAHLSLHDILHLSSVSGDCRIVIRRILKTFRGSRNLPGQLSLFHFETEGGTREKERLHRRKTTALEWIKTEAPGLKADLSPLLDPLLHCPPQPPFLDPILSLRNLVQVTCYVTEANQKFLMKSLDTLIAGNQALRKVEVYGPELFKVKPLPPLKVVQTLQVTSFRRFLSLQAPKEKAILLALKPDVTPEDTHFLKDLRGMKKLYAVTVEEEIPEELKKSIIRELGKNAKLWLTSYREGEERIVGHQLVARHLAIKTGLFEAIEEGSGDKKMQIKSFKQVEAMEHIRAKEIIHNSFAIDVLQRLSMAGGKLKSLELFQKKHANFDYANVEFLSVFPFDYLRLIPFLREQFGGDYILCVHRSAMTLPPLPHLRLQALSSLTFISFYLDMFQQVSKEVIGCVGKIRPKVPLLGLMSITSSLDVILLLHQGFPALSNGKILGEPFRVSKGYEHVWQFFPDLRLLSREERPDDITQGSTERTPSDNSLTPPTVEYHGKRRLDKVSREQLERPRAKEIINVARIPPPDPDEATLIMDNLLDFQLTERNNYLSGKYRLSGADPFLSEEGQGGQDVGGSENQDVNQPNVENLNIPNPNSDIPTVETEEAVCREAEIAADSIS